MKKSERTKLRILAAAERLFSRQGIEGTSLREITVAAGLSNTSSVQYHFGGKEELLDSLFNHRMLEMEPRRKAMLDDARKKGLETDVGTLMGIICLPHLDLLDSDRRYSYAEFLAQYLLRYRPPVGPLVDPPEPPAPIHLFTVQKLLRDRLSHLPDDVVVRRLVTSVLSFLAVLINGHSMVRNADDPGRFEVALADTLRQICVTMELPFADDSGQIAVKRKG